MKIIYVGMKYDYGDPNRGYSFEHYNFYDTLIKMNGGSNEVIYFPFDEIIRKVGRDKMNEQLLETAYQEKPDLCFFFLFGDEFKKEIIKEITKKSGAITFNWFADDHWRFENFSKYWAPYFNWVATTDSQAVKKYHKIGYKNVIKSQWACNHFLYKPLGLQKIYGVTFVGQPHGNRKKIIGKIKKRGIKIECWGFGWPNGRISQVEEMIKIFSQSKINLNITNASGLNILKFCASVFLKRGNDKKIKLEPAKHWINNLKSVVKRTKARQIKARSFEVPVCRSFLMTSDADNLRDYYKDGKEIVIYKDIKDLIEKIKYYLEHEEEREEIAKSGYERTLRDHTYEKRFNEIFKIIGLKQ